MTDDNLKTILEKMIVGKVKRIKTGNRYDKALVTMFRKRFNTKLKLNNSVNSNVAELVMAHKLPGAQSNYTKPTMEECFKEIKKAIPELTIDSRKRQSLEIKAKQHRIDELESKNVEIISMKEQLQSVTKQLREKDAVVPPEHLEKLIKQIISKEYSKR